MPRVSIKPELLRWAREREGRDIEDFPNRFKKLAEWDARRLLTHLQPTGGLRQEHPHTVRLPLPTRAARTDDPNPGPPHPPQPAAGRGQPRPSGNHPHHAAPPSVAPRGADDGEAEPARFRGQRPSGGRTRGHRARDAPDGRTRRRLGRGGAVTWREAVGTPCVGAIEGHGRHGGDQRRGRATTHAPPAWTSREFRGFALSDEHWRRSMFVNGADAKVGPDVHAGP